MIVMISARDFMYVRSSLMFLSETCMLLHLFLKLVMGHSVVKGSHQKVSTAAKENPRSVDG